MHIHFTSSERPKRFVKALRKTLLDSGHDIPFARLQEAAGVMFGYRGWNDLLGQQGKAPASRPDHELDLAVLGVRYSIFAERLAKSADLPIQVAQSALRETRPTARRQILDRTNWSGVFDRMARAVTLLAKSVEPFSTDGMDGFIVTLKTSRPPESFRLVVSDDGARAFVGSRNGHHASHLGQTLHRYGLGRPVDGSDVAHPLIAATIARLSPAALSILVTSSAFSSATYEFMHRLPQDAPLRGLVGKCPLVGGQMALNHWGKVDLKDPMASRLSQLHLAIAYGKDYPIIDEIHEISSNQFDPDIDQVGKAREDGFRLVLEEGVSRSQNGEGAVEDAFYRFIDIIEAEIERAWERESPGREAIVRTVREVGQIYIPCGPVFRNEWLGLLAFCPQRLLPSSPEALNSARSVIDGWRTTYTSARGADILALFGDLEHRFGGDWNALGAAVNALGGFSVTDCVGKIIARKLMIEADDNLADSVKCELFSGWVREAVWPALFDGRSILACKEAYATIQSTVDLPRPGNLPNEDRQLFAERDYDILIRSDVIPERLRFDRASDLMTHIGEDWKAALGRAQQAVEVRSVGRKL